METVDIQVPARDIRQGDHIVPADGTVRVVVATAERNGWAWITTFGEPARRYDPREPVTLRCPTARGSGYAYYADEGHVYRHVGSGVFELGTTALISDEH